MAARTELIDETRHRQRAAREFGRLSVFESHDMRIVLLSPVPPLGFLVTCACGDAQRVEWFDRTDPDTELAERITVAYRKHLTS